VVTVEYLVIDLRCLIIDLHLNAMNEKDHHAQQTITLVQLQRIPEVILWLVLWGLFLKSLMLLLEIQL